MEPIQRWSNGKFRSLVEPHANGTSSKICSRMVLPQIHTRIATTTKPLGFCSTAENRLASFRKRSSNYQVNLVLWHGAWAITPRCLRILPINQSLFGLVYLPKPCSCIRHRTVPLRSLGLAPSTGTYPSVVVSRTRIQEGTMELDGEWIFLLPTTQPFSNR